jgi:hypothetical protein
MADATYLPKVYKKDGGDTQIVASGGVLNIETGGKLQNNGVDMDLSAGIATSTTSSTAELNTLTGILATTAELNRAADVSTRLVAAGSTLAVTVLAHDAKIIKLDTASGSVCTLPAAAGTGAIFRFVVSVTPTTNAHIVKVTGDDVMYGLALGLDSESVAANAWATAADSDTITMDSSTQGGEVGDSIECIDIAADTWAVQVRLTQSGTEASPFSAGV